MTLAFYDGQFVDSGSIRISPADYGFSRGVALYEFTRVYGGIPFHLDDHLDRFEHSSKALKITTPYSPREIEQAVMHLCAHNKFAHSTIRIFLTAGECLKAGATLGYSGDFTPHLMIFEDEMNPPHAEAPKGGLELYRRGINLKTVPFAREIPGVKSVNYTRGFLAAQELAAQGWDEILYTHSDGYVTETTMANFFCVIEGVLCTPARGMLWGVTRKLVLDLAPQIGLKIAEKDVTLAELAKTTEAFTSASYAELLPVKKLDDHILPTTTEGPVFSVLRKAYTDYIRAYCDTRKQKAA